MSRSEPTFVVKFQAERLGLSDQILSFVYIDEEEKADKLTLTVDNFDLSQLD